MPGTECFTCINPTNCPTALLRRSYYYTHFTEDILRLRVVTPLPEIHSSQWQSWDCAGSRVSGARPTLLAAALTASQWLLVTVTSGADAPHPI